MLVKDTELINACDNNLLNMMRKHNITTVEDVLKVPSIRCFPKESMSSLQYAGIRDLFCYQYLGTIADLSTYLSKPVYWKSRNIGVEDVHIDFYYQYPRKSQMDYILYRLGCNRRDTIMIIETIQYFFEHGRDPFTLETILEYLDSMKEKLIKKERDKCLFNKISLLLEMNQKVKEQKATEFSQK